MTILRTTRPLATLAALALVLAACGGSAATTATRDTPANGASSAETGAPTVEKIAYTDSVLADAATAQNEVSSGRFEIRATGSSAEMAGDLTVSGEFDTSREAARIVVDLSAIDLSTGEGDEEGTTLDLGDMFDRPMTILTIGPDTYLSGGFASMLGATDGKWLRLDSDSFNSDRTDSMTGGMPGDFGTPQDMFDEFRDSDLTVTEVGTATYDGVETTEYEITSDDPSVSPIRVWIGADDLIRHFETTQSPDGESAEMTLIGDLFGYGESVSIEAPDASTVIEAPDFGD